MMGIGKSKCALFYEFALERHVRGRNQTNQLLGQFDP